MYECNEANSILVTSAMKQIYMYECNEANNILITSAMKQR